MTYKELAEKIAALTPEQQAQEAIFAEPYDNWAILPVTHLSIVGEDEQLVDEDGDTIEPGQAYLE
jgi:hypothetical protein